MKRIWLFLFVFGLGVACHAQVINPHPPHDAAEQGPPGPQGEPGPPG